MYCVLEISEPPGGKNTYIVTMKTIIITGANGNLGAEVTYTFLDKGYRVLATVRNEQAKVGMPEHANQQVSVVDLTNENATAGFVSEAIRQYEQIDAAVMLAGGFAMGDIPSTSLDDIRTQLAMNFDTAYSVTHAVYQHMMDKKRGRLIYIGARPAIVASAGKDMVAYSLSKSLLFKLAEFINADASGKDVTATVIVPSIIDTPPNRQNMPGIDPRDWVQPAALAEMIELIVSEKGNALREVVLKMYNNS